jgi:hypothetical protein
MEQILPITWEVLCRKSVVLLRVPFWLLQGISCVPCLLVDVILYNCFRTPVVHSCFQCYAWRQTASDPSWKYKGFLHCRNPLYFEMKVVTCFSSSTSLYSLTARVSHDINVLPFVVIGISWRSSSNHFNLLLRLSSLSHHAAQDL